MPLVKFPSLCNKEGQGMRIKRKIKILIRRSDKENILENGYLLFSKIRVTLRLFWIGVYDIKAQQAIVSPNRQ